MCPSIANTATPAKSDVNEFSAAMRQASATTSSSAGVYDPNATIWPVPMPRLYTIWFAASSQGRGLRSADGRGVR